MRLSIIVFTVATLLLSSGPAAAQPAKDLPIFGYLERVFVGPGQLLLIAKLDTGADSSSLGYQEIKHFKRDGKAWVRFAVLDEANKLHSFERPVIRTAEIRRRRGQPPISRPVVMMQLCLGNIYRETPMNLSSRKHFSTQLLIGRTFLSRTALVNSGGTLTTRPKCKKEPAK